MTSNFSHDDFRQKICFLKNSTIICDYSEVKDSTERFCIIRHDIEYSIDRALELAEIESELGVSASYFFQIRNNTYNALSNVNVKKIKKIRSLGHKIGLHVYVDRGSLLNVKNLEDMIKGDILILESFLQCEVDRFSYHRPTIELLNLKINVPEKINAYDNKFFTVFGKEDLQEGTKVLYLADSNHRWKYGEIEDINFRKNKKIQILFHPFSWSPRGLDNLNNFKNLLNERYNELKADIKNEITTFPKEL